MRYGRFFLGVLVALLLVGVVASAAWTAYNIGVQQGIVASGNLVVPPVEGGTVAPVPYYAPYGWGRPGGWGHFWGFGWFACLVPLFFIFMFFVLMRLVFRPRWGRGWGGPRGWDSAEGEIPPGVREWHRRMHEQDRTPPAEAPAAQV